MLVHIKRDWVYLPGLQKIISSQLVQILGPEEASLVPPVWDIENSRTQLLLVNWHWSFGSFVRSNPPTLVGVAAMHCKEPRPLPNVSIIIFFL
jgi:hypothetical protein